MNKYLLITLIACLLYGCAHQTLANVILPDPYQEQIKRNRERRRWEEEIKANELKVKEKELKVKELDDVRGLKKLLEKNLLDK